jgi:S-disulfanyl-L-cysteine oxidoreductase SoxD
MLKHIAVGTLVLMISAAFPGGSIAQEDKSIWDGVFTQEQADRGKKINSGVCAKCHGERGDGANEPDQPGGPAIARFSFLRKWEGTSIAALFAYIKTEMPPDNPASRTDQEYIDVIAHMLALSGAPVGEEELPIDPAALDLIYIEQKPE